MKGAINSNNNANNKRENCFLSEYCKMALFFSLLNLERIYGTKMK